MQSLYRAAMERSVQGCAERSSEYSPCHLSGCPRVLNVMNSPGQNSSGLGFVVCRKSCKCPAFIYRRKLGHAAGHCLPCRLGRVASNQEACRRASVLPQVRIHARAYVVFCGKREDWQKAGPLAARCDCVPFAYTLNCKSSLSKAPYMLAIRTPAKWKRCPSRKVVQNPRNAASGSAVGAVE